MQLTLVKTILAFVLAAAGLAAAGSMLTLLGRAEHSMQAGTLKAVHRTAGYVFAVTLAALAVMGAGILSAAGDTLPVRGVLHWVLGSLLVLVAALKIVLVKYYKKLLKFAPALGLTVLVLALLVAAVSAGFVLVTGEVERKLSGEEIAGDAAPERRGDAAAGGETFRSNCTICHRTDSDVGPAGFVGLFEREALVSSGLPVTRENIRAQILNPVGRMPSFKARLSESEITNVVAFLETI